METQQLAQRSCPSPRTRKALSCTRSIGMASRECIETIVSKKCTKLSPQVNSHHRKMLVESKGFSDVIFSTHHKTRAIGKG